MGHNVALLTRPNCFGWYFFRLKRFSEIGLAVFPEAKWFSGQNFRVKNEIQNSIPEFASHYGMPVDRIGNGIGNGRRLALPAPAPARRPAGLARPATGHGHRLPARVAGPTHGRGLRPRPATAPATQTGHGQRTARPHGHGKPATVKTWRSAGTVAAGFKQKSRQPVREAGKGRRPVFKRGRRVGLGLLYSRIRVWFARWHGRRTS